MTGRLAERALRKLQEGDQEGAIALAGNFTEEAHHLLEAAGVTVAAAGGFEWIDANWHRVRQRDSR